MSDAELERVLRPEQTTESAGLYRGRDGRLYYVAQLGEQPPKGFVDDYSRVVTSRGFLALPSGSSPHDFPRTEAYYFFFFRKGRTRPYTLVYRRFYDVGDQERGERSYFRSFPGPLRLEEGRLTVRLGTEALAPWREAILVPDRDVVEVAELPFPRFSRAVIARVDRPEDEDDFRSNTWISRWYVARGVTMEEVLSHYRAAIGKLGIDLKRDSSQQPGLSAFLQTPHNGIQRSVSVSSAPFVLIPGETLSVDDLRRLCPAVVQDFPADVVSFQVFLDFVNTDTAAQYWPKEDQERRKTLLAGEKDKK